MHQNDMILVATGILKILVLSMNDIFPMVVMIYCKKLWVLMMLLLLMLKQMLTEFNFGIWAKMMQLAWLAILIWSIKEEETYFFW